ncbi:unnamed protein product [Paramecium pentaurelia]|uniref:Uncharacterized protein n=1 Tax=Paramecium pentaurelia TaxID=43138 RepID=A0A8S1YA83_9CILI|nr:unnamed protein product [Paramecium pentaurelia]
MIRILIKFQFFNQRMEYSNRIKTKLFNQIQINYVKMIGDSSKLYIIKIKICYQLDINIIFILLAKQMKVTLRQEDHQIVKLKIFLELLQIMHNIQYFGITNKRNIHHMSYYKNET